MESDESVRSAKTQSASAPVNDDDKTRPRGRRRSRVKRLSSSSSSSSSSSESSSSSSTSSSVSRRSRKNSHSSRRKKKGGGKRRHRRGGSRKIRKLTRQIDDLRKQIVFCSNDPVPCTAMPCIDDNLSVDENLVDGNISGELYENNETSVPTVQSDFTFEIETKLKEPSVPKTPQNFLKILKDIQHLESNDWSEVRYADTQKLYNCTPGFVDLEVNDEIKAYDSLRHLAHAEKAFAALSFCVLKQREALQSSIRSFLQWARDSELPFEAINEKVNELFLKGDFFKVSADLLQLACGHRAEVIQMRRDGITKHLRDPLVKAALRKIPPSCEHVFSAESLATALEKAGGVRKAFLPIHKPGTTASVSQTGQSKPSRYPSQGQAIRNLPSQGNTHGCCASAHISHAYSQPSQGCGNSRPSQGQVSNHADNRPAYPGGSRGSFRSRGSRAGYRNQNSRGDRKRPASPTENRNKKRKF